MKTITYMTSLLTFYLKGEISTEKNFLSLKIPNTVLALIPLGAQKHNVPVNQLSAVATSFSLAFKELICIHRIFIFSWLDHSFDWRFNDHHFIQDRTSHRYDIRKIIPYSVRRF